MSRGGLRVLLAAQLMLALAAAPAGADEASRAAWNPTDAPIPLAGPVDENTYHVGPGDVLTLLLWGPIGRSVPLVVGPEGGVLLPDIGPLHVGGLTLREARAEIVGRMRSQLRGVSVEVQLTRLRTFRVYLTGLVRGSGPALANAACRVVDVVPDSLFLPGASRRSVTVTSPSGERRVVDLERMRRLGDTAADTWLRDGDVIHVPAVMGYAAVWGAVPMPGPIEAAPSDDLARMMAMAGGAGPQVRRDSLLLVRFVSPVVAESVWFSLGPDGAPSLNPGIREGDRVFVFERTPYHEGRQVQVMGRVARPGTYPVHPGITRLTEIVSAAGGLLPDADRSAILLVRTHPAARTDAEFERLSRLTRGDMTSSEYESFRVRLAALSPEFRVDWSVDPKGDPERDPILVQDDIVRVAQLTNTVRVGGEVRRPGIVPFRPGAGIHWYLAEAGGLSRRAARTQVRVTRAASGQVLYARDVRELAPGDFIWVPERPDFSPWSLLRDVLVVGAQLATITVALRR